MFNENLGRNFLESVTLTSRAGWKVMINHRIISDIGVPWGTVLPSLFKQTQHPRYAKGFCWNPPPLSWNWCERFAFFFGQFWTRPKFRTAPIANKHTLRISMSTISPGFIVPLTMAIKLRVNSPVINKAQGGWYRWPICFTDFPWQTAQWPKRPKRIKLENNFRSQQIYQVHYCGWLRNPAPPKGWLKTYK